MRFVPVAASWCPSLGHLHVALVCLGLWQKPCDQQYPMAAKVVAGKPSIELVKFRAGGPWLLFRAGGPWLLLLLLVVAVWAARAA